MMGLAVGGGRGSGTLVASTVGMAITVGGGGTGSGASSVIIQAKAAIVETSGSFVAKKSWLKTSDAAVP